MKYAHRAKELGIQIGRMTTGDLNGLVDVSEVRVGHVTLISDGVIQGACSSFRSSLHFGDYSTICWLLPKVGDGLIEINEQYQAIY